MGALDRIRSLFGIRAAPAVPSGYELKDGIVVASSANTAPTRGTRNLIASYKISPRLRAVVSRIARGMSTLRVRVYTRTAEPAEKSRAATFKRTRDPLGALDDVAVAPRFEWGTDRGVRDIALIHGGSFRQRAERRRELAKAGELREVSDHPMLELLANPNPEMSGATATFLTEVWLSMKGEAFWLLTLDGTGKPTQYWPVPPHWVTSTPTKTAPYFVVSFMGAQLRVPATHVVWFRDPDPENPYGRGTGVAESLGDEIETDEYAAKYLKNWFHNSALPNAIVSFEGATAETVKQMKTQWDQEHRGFSNAHRVRFAVGKMNAQRLDASLKEQQMTELREFSRDIFPQVFGVPPEIVGIITNSNRSTIDGASYIFALGVEFPRAEFYRSELQRQLAPKYDEALAVEMEVPIPDDANRRLEVMKALPGAFGVNEWREEGGREPLAQFDGVFPPLAQPGQAPASDKPAETPADEPKNPEPTDEGDDDEEEPASTSEAKAFKIPDDPAWARALNDENSDSK